MVPEGQRSAGGWYYNQSSGLVERWWPDGSGPGASQSSGGNQSNNQSTPVAATQFPEFNFNFDQEQTKAYDELKPFYEKIIGFAQGDMDQAKRMIQYTYDQGIRENTQEFQARKEENERLAPRETEQQQTSLNRRGILNSGIANKDLGDLKSNQDARSLAVQRAYDNRSGRLEKEKDFGMEEQDKGFEKESFQSERDRRKEAQGMAQTRFGIESTRYSTDLAKAERGENKQIQQKENDQYQNYLQNQGFNFGG